MSKQDTCLIGDEDSTPGGLGAEMPGCLTREGVDWGIGTGTGIVFGLSGVEFEVSGSFGL